MTEQTGRTGARSGDGPASYNDILMTLSNTDVVVRCEPEDPRARAGIERIGVGKDSLELGRAIGAGSTRFSLAMSRDSCWDGRMSSGVTSGRTTWIKAVIEFRL